MVLGASATSNQNLVVSSPLVKETFDTTEKVKYIFNLSAWLYIGSALSASTGIGILLLKMAGQVPFTKPFALCVVSSIVLGFLGEMYKDWSIDCTPMTDTMKSFVPSHTALSEGSSFTYENQRYCIASTLGDGACGAHAVLGTKENGYSTYAYRQGNVRFAYIDALLALSHKQDDPAFIKWKEWMIQFVKDYLSPHRGISSYSTFVFNEELVKNLKDALLSLEGQKNELQLTQRTLFDQALQDEDSLKRILSRVSKDSLIHTKMQENLDDIIDVLSGTEIGKSIDENKQAQIKIDQQRDECFKTFVEKDEVLAAYIEGVNHESYYFSTQELGVMAYFFKKHVTVFHQLSDGRVDIFLKEGDISHPSAVVFHQENRNHFSRCEPQNSL